MSESTVLKRFVIKSKTNDGEFAKQYNTVLAKSGYSPALIIRKLVYTKNFDSYVRSGFKLLKKFNSSGLVEQYFSIKLSTLKIVIDALKPQSIIAHQAKQKEGGII